MLCYSLQARVEGGMRGLNRGNPALGEQAPPEQRLYNLTLPPPMPSRRRPSSAMRRAMRCRASQLGPGTEQDQARTAGTTGAAGTLAPRPTRVRRARFWH